MTSKPRPDWEAIESEFRIGLLSVRQIADKFGVSHTAVQKQAKRHDWPRDLSEKARQKAADLVAKSAVANRVSSERAFSERVAVEVAAKAMADAELGQRKDVSKARTAVSTAWQVANERIAQIELLTQFGAMMRNPDEFGQDKLNDMYLANVSFPQLVKDLKTLADALKALVDVERRVFKLDSQPANDQRAKVAMTDTQVVARLAYLLEKTGVRLVKDGAA